VLPVHQKPGQQSVNQRPGQPELLGRQGLGQPELPSQSEARSANPSNHKSTGKTELPAYYKPG
jgi:hypothetical protein